MFSYNNLCLITIIMHDLIQQPYLIKFVIKLAELCHLLHHLLAHEERSVEHRESLVIQRPHR